MRGLASLLGIAVALTACEPVGVPVPKAGPSDNAVTRTGNFQCNDLSMVATFTGDDDVQLMFGDRTLILPRIPSASGARYADDKGNEFWNKGLDALFTVAGEEPRTCESRAPAAATGAAAGDGTS